MAVKSPQPMLPTAESSSEVKKIAAKTGGDHVFRNLTSFGRNERLFFLFLWLLFGFRFCFDLRFRCFFWLLAR
jgi:hypothetical protein